MLTIHVSRFPITRILLFSGLVLCGSALKADIIYSNFGSGMTYTDGAGVIVSDGSVETSVAEEFSPTANYTLSSIEFVASTKTPASSNSVTVSIYADNGGVPATAALESITLSGQLAPFDGTLSPVLTATSVAKPDLMAGLQYWLVMDAPAVTSPQNEYLVWDNNSTLAVGYLETNGTPGDWQNSPNPFASETNGVFEVDGTLIPGPTPEPGTWMLLPLGLGLMSVVARRRSQRAA